MIDLTENNGGSFALELEAGGLGNAFDEDSGRILLDRCVEEATSSMLVNAYEVILKVFRAHLVELLENNRAALVRIHRLQFDVETNVDKIANSYLSRIQGIAAEIVRESGGFSIEINADTYAMGFIEEVRTALHLPDAAA